MAGARYVEAIDDYKTACRLEPSVMEHARQLRQVRCRACFRDRVCGCKRRLRKRLIRVQLQAEAYRARACATAGAHSN